jgi:energy-coupling factor transport system ATP-binding protein
MPSAPPAPEAAPPAQWRQASVRYPFAETPAVGPATLTVAAGERLLLLGPSGSGKSTLLLTLTGLIPQSIPAEVAGAVRLFGAPVEARRPSGWAATVAHLFQDADQTLCGMRVEDEIAFALENRALPEAVITAKVDEAMRRLDLPAAWRRRRTTTLSLGERQLVALAATLAQEAPLFVADEPTAHPAPAAAARLHCLLTAPGFTERGRARSVLIVDHRLDGLIGSVDRVAVLGRDGTIIATGPPGALFREQRGRLDALGIWRPLASFLDAALEQAGLAPAVPPLSVADALRHLEGAPAATLRKARAVVAAFVAAHSAAPVERPGAPVVARLVAADCAPFLGPIVLRDVSLDLRAGAVLGILGANGAGKSTLAASLAGLLRLKRGRREGAPGGIAFQKSENQFTAATVRAEIAAALPRPAHAAQVDAILAAWDLAGLQGRHPFELSQGQKRRLALAALTAGDRWPLIILDEPLAGLDAAGAAMVVGHVEALRRAGRAVAIVTHDMDFALRLCPRAVILGEGGIIARGPTARLLADAALLERAGLAAPTIAPALRWLERVAAC